MTESAPIAECPVCGNVTRGICGAPSRCPYEVLCACENACAVQAENTQLKQENEILRSQDWDALKAHHLHMDKIPLAKRPVAWRVKDFADGWIIYRDEAAAYKEHERTGALMQGLYVRDGT